MANRERDDGTGSDFDPRGGYEQDDEHVEPREFRFGRAFDLPEPGRLQEQRHETGYTRPYDRWSPDDYVFYSGVGYHREFVEPYKEPRRASPQAGRGFAGRGPRGYVRSDSRIHEEVCERLSDAGDLDAGGIEVRVEGGEVTLEGTVPDRSSKRLAEDIAESVRGVRETHNRLRVGSREIGTSSGEQGREADSAGSRGVDVTVRGPASHSGSGVLSPPEVEPLDSGQASPAFPPATTTK
jgi:hypothetical protein